MRIDHMRHLPKAPLTLLLLAVVGVPLAGVAASGAPDQTYRAPHVLTPGWGSANAEADIDYLSAGFVSAPPPAGTSTLVGLGAAVTAVEDVWGTGTAAPAEIALRTVRVRPGSVAIRQAGFEGERLVYLVIFHNSPVLWLGGPYRADPAGRAVAADPGQLCLEVTVVDARTGQLLRPTRTQVCR
jgi:hypothetical protein